MRPWSSHHRSRRLADLARGELRAKFLALREALAGRFRAHHAFPVSQLLAHLDYLDETITTFTTLSERTEEAIAAFADELARLDTSHWGARRTAEVLIAELGVDMSQFPSDRHLASRPGLCPGEQRECQEAQAREEPQGQPLAASCLVEAALAAVRTSNSAFAARYHRSPRLCW